MRIITGTITNGVTLSPADGEVVIGGVVTNYSNNAKTSAVYGGAGIVGGDISNGGGTIGDTTGTSYGILLQAGGTITNGTPTATAATIEGAYYGVLLRAMSTVANYGSILGATYDAVRIEGGGKLTNGSTADSVALISATSAIPRTSYGVDITGTGTITNFGTIKSAIRNGGVLLDSGTVINGAGLDSQSLIEGAVTGVMITGVHGTVSNFGTILATATSSTGVSFVDPGRLTNGSSTETTAMISGSTGILATDGISLTNFGTITSTDPSGVAVSIVGVGTIVNGGTNSTAALISGSAGIYVNVAHMTNFGTIVGTGFSGNAVVLGQGGTVTNGAVSSRVAVINGGFAGIYSHGGGLITNHGTIEGVELGIVFAAGGEVINGSSSDKTALIGNSHDGIVVADTVGTYGAIVTNFGTIAGYSSAVAFGAGNDQLNFEAGAKFVGAVSGGGGTDTVSLIGSGKFAVSNFSGFEDFAFASGAAETLTLTNANFVGVTSATITVTAGTHGEMLNASAVSGTGNHVDFVGGAGADTITGGGVTTMTGNGGANEFIFTRAGTNTITDFGFPATNEIVLGDSGFKLGLPGATATPQALPSTLFVSDSAGTFTNATQRFAYDTANGELYYDADGNGTGSSRHGVAILTGAPSLSASQLFFVT